MNKKRARARGAELAKHRLTCRSRKPPQWTKAEKAKHRFARRSRSRVAATWNGDVGAPVKNHRVSMAGLATTRVDNKLPALPCCTLPIQ